MSDILEIREARENLRKPDGVYPFEYRRLARRLLEFDAEIERLRFRRDLYFEWWKAVCDVELEQRREIVRLREELSAGD